MRQPMPRQLAGGPLKPGFGLSGAVRRPDKVFPPLVRVFVPCIRTRSLRVPQPGDVTTAGPSTPRIITLHDLFRSG